MNKWDSEWMREWMSGPVREWWISEGVNGCMNEWMSGVSECKNGVNELMNKGVTGWLSECMN